MAYIQSTTPLDDNKEITGTTGQDITPALNSSAGDPSTTNNAATPPSSNFIQPTSSQPQQGTGFTNLQTYLDKNQGASKQLSSALTGSINDPNQTSSTSYTKQVLSQDIGGRTELLRGLSPKSISNQGLNLNEYLTQPEFKPQTPDLPIYNNNYYTQPSTPVVQPTPVVPQKPTAPAPTVTQTVPSTTLLTNNQGAMQRAENDRLLRQIVNQRNGVQKQWNPNVQNTPSYDMGMTVAQHGQPKQYFAGQTSMAANPFQYTGATPSMQRTPTANFQLANDFVQNQQARGLTNYQNADQMALAQRNLRNELNRYATGNVMPTTSNAYDAATAPRVADYVGGGSQQGFGRNYAAEQRDASVRQAALDRLMQTYKY